MAAKSSPAKPPKAAKTDKTKKPKAPKLDKAARAEAKQAKRAASRERRKRLFQAFNQQRKQDKALLPMMIGLVVLGGGVFFGVGLIFGVQWGTLPLGIALGALGAVMLFGQRMQRSVYKQADGQPGAAGWAVDNMKGPWRVTQGVAGTTQLDVVHRVIGKPGVILVAEGAPHRANKLLAQEKKRTARLIGQIPIYDIFVGNEEGQVPLRKLQRHLTKLPHNITPKQMDVVEGRLTALGSRAAAVPKGPLPQGAKMRSVQRAARRR